MATSKLAVYETGYDDDRFEQIVSQTLHCIICTNVIKDPVMCRHNEHLFCRACITRYLMNSQTCPTCIEPLTVETLAQPSRTVTNLLTELKIRCEFFNRGCGKFVELGNLERHVKECGFAPAVCHNEGCRMEVNKQDLLHHETAVCERRTVKCHSPNNIRQEMDIVKRNLAEMNEKLDRNEKTFSDKSDRVEVKVEPVQDNVVAKAELVQDRVPDNVEMKKSLNEITKTLEKTAEESCRLQAEQMKKGVAEADEMKREPKVLIAGGAGLQKGLMSVEMFNLSNGTWTLLQLMSQGREGPASVVHDNHAIVTGGWDAKSMEKLSLNAVHDDKPIAWENNPAELPGPMYGHCSVVYQGRLIVIGGIDCSKYISSDSITEISLVPPYTSKLLATMPKKRCFHGVALFGDKILILGGGESLRDKSALENVVMYDITKNECRELAPLPYQASEMATVKWGDDNVIIVGGADSDGKPLNKVLIYNIKTQKSHMLPDMKYKRKGCVAAVVRDTVIVMGGRGERRNDLKSVEYFRFDSYNWQELPEMHEARWRATAVVC